MKWKYPAIVAAGYVPWIFFWGTNPTGSENVALWSVMIYGAILGTVAFWCDHSLNEN